MELFYICFSFFCVAVLYASVGFGGGSSYLAILALTGLAFTQIRATALLCNVVVVISNVYVFHKQKNIDWKKIIPLILFSIPLSYVGGFLKITQQFFFILLGITLLFAAVTMWLSNKIKSDEESATVNYSKNSAIGGFVGFISGMVGIGGGIFLAPYLHLSKWDTPKKIAATSSVFILVNSIAGLFGQVNNPSFEIDWNLTGLLLVTVFVGGLIGNTLSKKYFTPLQIKKATALLIAFVSLRILWKYLLM